MLFRRETLDGIASGTVTLAFRRWKRPAAKSGSRVRTSRGVVRIGAVEPTDPARLTEADARASGFADLSALSAMLGPDDGSPVYRIGLAGIEPDERIALREEAGLRDEDWAALLDRFRRWEKTQPGYFPAILRAIRDKPGVVSTDIAGSIGVERLKFKQDVRKLKELGLTESLETGYRLSARGKAVLKRLGGRS